ncbi:L-serine ammonia-lyase, iron-sulfur-dependent, subunit alpha, partial [Enterococcus sp. S181_ASV_20]|nr:L-serine ammonia-lyase, iron-sulfur-dependent, subunit alpha [Enterococcus sp. S181_ASV_20]
MQELVEQAKDYPTVGELMIATEMELTDRTREEIIALMERNLEVMESSIEEGIQGVTSVTRITGGDAKRMNDYIESGKFMSGETILK